jgi:hypothetical protein
LFKIHLFLDPKCVPLPSPKHPYPEIKNSISSDSRGRSTSTEGAVVEMAPNVGHAKGKMDGVVIKMAPNVGHVTAEETGKLREGQRGNIEV